MANPKPQRTRIFPLRITPGEIIVSREPPYYAHSMGWGKYAIVLAVDLVSKYGEVLCCSHGEGIAPAVFLSASERTLHIDEAHKGHSTKVEFTTLKGWVPMAANIGRYTLTVAFVRENWWRGHEYTPPKEDA